MALSIRETLAAKGIHPTAEHLVKLEAKWAEVQALKADLGDLPIDDADIALRNIPGGDHVE